MTPSKCAERSEANKACRSVQIGSEGQQDPLGLSLEVPQSEARFSHAIPNFSRLKKAKAFAEEAIKLHKIFSVQGPYPVVRAGLKARGWIEQYTQCNKQVQKCVNRPGREDEKDSEERCNDVAESEQDPDGLQDLASRLVRNEMVYFFWTSRREAILTKNLQKDQIVNYFSRTGSFVTKAGLCVNLRNLHWFDSADPDTFFPRCYRLGAQDERHAFIEDYRRTACHSFLKWIVERDDEAVSVDAMDVKQNDQTFRGQKKINKREQSPVILSKTIKNALQVCQDFLQSLNHNDIDISLDMAQVLSQEDWTEFLNIFYNVVHSGAPVEYNHTSLDFCKTMLEKLEDVSPQLGIDGVHNIWIVKPGAKSRGRGIRCIKQLDQILRLVDSDLIMVKDSKWVVQKYIERPFLIYNTKFDVRQWFLVTDWNPLTVWFYNKCYLRFATQPYSLDSLDRSVHLCNNSIQKNLKPSQQRHQEIPADNMWSDEQFRDFLASQGMTEIWESVVVPGMKKAVIHALQTSQDLIESRKNSFELYGADFVLGFDLHPWLIEINASPTMAASTPVTAKLCAAVQEDTLRVVLDRRLNRTANTGNFELIHRQAPVDVPQYIGIKLLVEGFTIKNPCSLPLLKPSSRSIPSMENSRKTKRVTSEKRENKTSGKSESVKPCVSRSIKMPLIRTQKTIDKHRSLGNKSQSGMTWKRKVDKTCKRPKSYNSVNRHKELASHQKLPFIHIHRPSQKSLK